MCNKWNTFPKYNYINKYYDFKFNYYNIVSNCESDVGSKEKNYHKTEVTVNVILFNCNNY